LAVLAFHEVIYNCYLPNHFKTVNTVKGTTEKSAITSPPHPPSQGRRRLHLHSPQSLRFPRNPKPRRCAVLFITKNIPLRKGHSGINIGNCPIHTFNPQFNKEQAKLPVPTMKLGLNGNERPKMKPPGLTRRVSSLNRLSLRFRHPPAGCEEENLHPPASSRLREVRRRNSGGNARGIKQSLISPGSIKQSLISPGSIKICSIKSYRYCPDVYTQQNSVFHL